MSTTPTLPPGFPSREAPVIDIRDAFVDALLADRDCEHTTEDIYEMADSLTEMYLDVEGGWFLSRIGR